MHTYRFLLVALLLLSLSANALALAHAACQQQPQLGSGALVMDPGMMDHSQHLGLSAAPSAQQSAVDCCIDCGCPSGNCGGALLVSVAEPNSAVISSLPPGDFTRFVASRMTDFLFRPPIFI